ncbi:MAG: Mur ligase family protein [Saprospiraceae bacterium]
MTYAQTLDYLYAQLPMFQRIGPAAFKKDLTNTLALAALVDNPHHKFQSVHIAGTNGKGSAAHMLAAVCQAAGLKTGLYISPHYKDFRERIKVNGKYIPRQQVVDFVEKHKTGIEAIKPSFFELCVVMAFDHFAREQVDIAIVEVGLGGRLDSTNIIMPLLSIITNISFDHQNMLGDTLPLIAGEKAGIIKKGVAVVVGETQAEVESVFRIKASETGSEIVFADSVYEVKANGSENNMLEKSSYYDVFKNGNLLFENLELETAGPYQHKNLVTTLQAWDLLRSRHFDSLNEKVLRSGLKHLKGLTRFIGRWEVLGINPDILCDSAHNEAGLRMSFEKVSKLSFDKLHIVTGFVNDKSVEKVLGLFPENARYYFAKANIPRGLDAAILKEQAAEYGLKGKAYSSVINAFKAAKRTAKPEDLILVTGSIFVVAEVLR